MESADELNDLLLRYSQGDAEAGEILTPLVHAELHRLASSILRRAPANQTLQTTDLLHEAWIRLDRSGGPISGREHFLAVAATAMRQILVDRARRRSADRRGGQFERIEMDAAVDLLESAGGDLLELDVALEELARSRPDLARVVEMRFFAGMKHPEIARVTQLPLRTVERDWATARAWLFARLKQGEGRPQ